VVNCEPTHPSCETFVKPKLAPPVHGDKVAEPLMSKLMGYNISDSVSVRVCGSLLVEEHSGGSTSVSVPTRHNIAHILTKDLVLSVSQ
jgi:hypothetical protein